jgi:RHS repeat-associated protein
VTATVSPAQTLTAGYRYDPFGRTLGSVGAQASANPMRFSSKPMLVDRSSESLSLYYYGYRFYDAQIQRWLNRDPIVEHGGLNVYIFVSNSPVALHDYLGLRAECGECGPDVTSMMYSTLGDIASTFAGESARGRAYACRSLAISHAWWSWDIRWLKNWPPGLGANSDPCRRHVIYQNKCVSPDELHYMMFGLMVKLCSYLGQVDINAAGTALFLRALVTSDTLDNVGTKIAFMEHGCYDSQLPDWVARNGCSSSSVQGRRPTRIEDWVWFGLKWD